MTFAEYVVALQAWAKGNRGLETAVDLLIAHRVWVTGCFGTRIGPLCRCEIVLRASGQWCHRGCGLGSSASDSKRTQPGKFADFEEGPCVRFGKHSST